MDAASQPAPPRRRTPRRTYTATRVSHPNYSRFTCPAAGLPSPLTHLWRPPAVAGAGGLHRWTAGPRTGAVDRPTAPPARLLRRPTRPSGRRVCHRPSATLASSPSVVGPACTPAATHHDPSVLAPVKAARAQPSHQHTPTPPADTRPPGPSLRRQEPRGSGTPAKRGCDIQVPPRRRSRNLQPGLFLS